MRHLIRDIRLDINANRGSAKSTLVVVYFRLASRCRASRFPVARLLYVPIGAGYKFLTEWILGIELPPSTTVGVPLTIHHGYGLVVNPATRIGNGVVLRQAVTLGNRGDDSGCPILGDGVVVGAGAVIVGPVAIGDGVRVRALSLVTENIPSRVGSSEGVAPVGS
jgi:putative colanic acid biosynthesis acetyltransferase WcaB